MNLLNWLCNWNVRIFDLVISPQDQQFGPWVIFLPVFCPSYYPRQFHMSHYGFRFWWQPGHPAIPSPTPGAWPRHQNKNTARYVLYLSFVRTEIFEIDFVIVIWWYLTFWPPGPRGGAKKCWLLHVSNSHTRFVWISSNGLGVYSITNGRTDGRTEAITISPSLFFKKKRGDDKPLKQQQITNQQQQTTTL